MKNRYKLSGLLLFLLVLSSSFFILSLENALAVTPRSDSKVFINQTNQTTLPPTDNNKQEVNYVPGELIVMIKEEKAANLSIAENKLEINNTSLDKLFKKFSVFKTESLYKDDSSKEKKINNKLPIIQQIKKKRLKNIFKLTLSKDIDIHSAVLEFKDNENIEYAEPNYLFSSSMIPNDPYFLQQWALNNTGQTGGKVDADIDAPEAWDSPYKIVQALINNQLQGTGTSIRYFQFSSLLVNPIFIAGVNCWYLFLNFDDSCVKSTRRLLWN